MSFAQRRPAVGWENPNQSAEALEKSLEERMQKFHKNGTAEFLLVVTPGPRSSQYGLIKRYCDRNGYASQCVTLDNVMQQGYKYPFALNMLLKINAKLGGINVSLAELPLVMKPITVCLTSVSTDSRLFWGQMFLIRHLALLAIGEVWPL